MTDVPVVPGEQCTPDCPTDTAHAHISTAPPTEPTGPIEVSWPGMLTPPRKIPVQYEFRWETVEGLAEYDPEGHVLTIRIRPGGPVDALLAGTDQDNQVRALSFAWTAKVVDAVAAKDMPRPVDVDEIALDSLLRLSERSTDGRLRDAIALVRSVLHDEVESRS